MELTPEDRRKLIAALIELRDSTTRCLEAMLKDDQPPTTAYAVGKAGDAVRLTLEVDGCDVTLRVQHTDEELRSAGTLSLTNEVALCSGGFPCLYTERISASGRTSVYVWGSGRQDDDNPSTASFPTPESARQACLDIIECVEQFNASRRASK